MLDELWYRKGCFAPITFAPITKITMAPPTKKNEQSPPEQSLQKQQLDLAVRNRPLPGNRPIVPTNKDPEMDDFVGYMD